MHRLSMLWLFMCRSKSAKTEMRQWPTEEDSWQRVQSNRESEQHGSEQCTNLGGSYKCMRCGIRSKHAKHPGMCCGFDGWRATDIDTEGHDWQRNVDADRKMLVWCRHCSGRTTVKLGGALSNHCQHFVDERKKKTGVLKITWTFDRG